MNEKKNVNEIVALSALVYNKGICSAASFQFLNSANSLTHLAVSQR